MMHGLLMYQHVSHLLTSTKCLHGPFGQDQISCKDFCQIANLIKSFFFSSVNSYLSETNLADSVVLKRGLEVETENICKG